MTDLSWLSMQPPPDSAPRADTRSTWRWATVVGTAPLQIRLDGETVPLPDPPETLVAGVAEGQRVWVQLHGRMAVIVGAARAARPPMLHGSLQAVTAVPSSSVVNIKWADATPADTARAATVSGATITIAQTGMHRLFGQATFDAASASGAVHLRLYINGALDDFVELPFGGARTTTQYFATRHLTAGTQIVFSAYQNSGAGSVLDLAYRMSRCEIERVSD